VRKDKGHPLKIVVAPLPERNHFLLQMLESFTCWVGSLLANR